MAFETDDFFVGMIAYFTVNDLRRHRRIRTTNPTRDIKPRPFVCYAEHPDTGDAYWTCLTGTPNPQRRTIARQWLRCPTGAFRSCYGDLIIADGRSSFVGPPSAFAECSHRHDRFDGVIRPMLLPEGVDEVRMAVQSRRGLMPTYDAAARAA
jgi:hypothetical protein